jgi:hypothetical protein
MILLLESKWGGARIAHIDRLTGDRFTNAYLCRVTHAENRRRSIGPVTHQGSCASTDAQDDDDDTS